MKKYSLLSDLSESRQYPSQRYLERENFIDLTEAALAIVMSLRVLLEEDSRYAADYVHRTISPQNFQYWRQNGTDLYHILHALSTGGYDDDGGRHPGQLTVIPIQRWLKALDRSHRSNESETMRLFLRIERLLFIKDSSLKAIRRLIMDWPSLSRYEKKLALTRLTQIIKTRCQKIDIFPELNHLVKTHGLEIKGACNADTETCATPDRAGDIVSHATLNKPKDNHFLSSLAGFASGAAAGYGLVRHKVRESDAGTTTAANVASVAAPLGAIQRRPKTVTENGGVIRIAPHANNLLEFMDAYREQTTPHPFAAGQRLYGYAVLTVRPFDGAIHISDIASVDRREGHGTAAMTMLCALADEFECDLTLTAKSYSEVGMTTPQLVMWYQKFNFVIESQDFDSFSMRRRFR